MTSQEWGVVALGATAGVLVWILLVWITRDYMVDSFRQRMFELRDDLFDFALEGQIDFDHRAYGTLRSMMNGFIRFGHQLGVLQVLMGAAFLGRSGLEVAKAFEEQQEDARKDLPPAVREKLAEYHVRMHLLVMRHVVLGSPLFLVTVVVPLMISLDVFGTLGRLVRWLAPLFRRIDATAFAVGR